MDKSDPPSSGGYPPADFRRRILARLCDLALGLMPLLLLRAHLATGALFSAALFLSNDLLFGPGRSLGKRLFGLRCIVLATRRPAGLTASARRNLFLAGALVPALLAHAQPFFATAVLLVMAASLETFVALAPLTRDLGQRRLGDLWAGTQVIDASVALSLPAALPDLAAVAGVMSASPPEAANTRVAAGTRIAAAARLVDRLKPRPAPSGPGAREAAIGRLEEPACASP